MSEIAPINRIVIQSNQLFDRTIKGFEEIGSQDNFYLRNGFASVGDKFTRRANTCGILGMSNGKTTMIKHVAPESKPRNFIEQLDEIVKRFKDETGKLHAIITGGWDCDVASKSQAAIDSSILLSEMGEVLDKNFANLSMIAWKRNPTFTDGLAVTKDSFILTHDPILGKKGLPIFPKDATPSEISRILDDNYRINEIDDAFTICYEG